MYQPAIKDEAVRSIYRAKRALGQPMTVVLDELLIKGFSCTDRKKVCSVCQQEGNRNCESCYLNQR